MKRIYIMIIMLVTILLCSCDMKVVHNSPESIIDSMYEVLTDRDDKLGVERNPNFKDCIYVLGKYKDGYLLIYNDPESKSNQTYLKQNVCGVYMYTTLSANFYYYIDNQFERDLLYTFSLLSFEEFYENGYLTKGDLSDIKRKIDTFSEDEIPYLVRQHFPID